MGEVTGQLGRGLDHQYAGKQRPARDMAADPPVILADVVISGKDAVFSVAIDDSIEQGEFMPVRIHFSDRLGVSDQVIEIQGIWIENDWRGHVPFRFCCIAW